MLYFILLIIYIYLMLIGTLYLWSQENEKWALVILWVKPIWIHHAARRKEDNLGSYHNACQLMCPSYPPILGGFRGVFGVGTSLVLGFRRDLTLGGVAGGCCDLRSLGSSLHDGTLEGRS